MIAKTYDSIAICTFVNYKSDNLHLIELVLKICAIFPAQFQTPSLEVVMRYTSSVIVLLNFDHSHSVQIFFSIPFLPFVFSLDFKDSLHLTESTEIK